ncbi:hypothetical protein, partial [Nocardia sp. NPDC004722]
MPDSLRLSALGGDSAAVLRVIAHFDAFDESAANADTVIRAAALLAECPVGAIWSSGTVIRYDAAGRLLPAISTAVHDSAGADPAVWLERRASCTARGACLSASETAGISRPGRLRDRGEGADRGCGVDPGHATHPDCAPHPDCAAHPLDPVVVDRVRHCLRVVSARRAANPLRMDDPALLEVVLSGKERREDRVRAMRLLGLDPARATRVLAVAGPGAAEAVRIIGEHVPMLRHAVIGATVAVLVQDPALSSRAADHGRGGADSPAAGEDSQRLRGIPAGASWRPELSPTPVLRGGIAQGQGQGRHDHGNGPGFERQHASDSAGGLGVTMRRAGQVAMADHAFSDALNFAVVHAFPASRTGAGGPWIGMGERVAAVAAATSWEQARRALRFASSTWHGRRVVAFERLGSL